MVICFFKICAPSVLALDLDPKNYFDVTYNTRLSKTHIQTGETFNLIIEGTATCIKDLPIGIDRAELALRLNAYNKDSNTQIVLIDAFVISIDPFPDWENDSYQFQQSINLVLPPNSDGGNYDILGQLVSARIDGWDITDLIPSDLFTFNFGTLTYDSATPTSPIEIMMNISPRQVSPGEAVTIAVQIRNNTSIETYYVLKISVNGILQDHREITLAPLEIKPVTLIIERYEEGDYIVSFNGHSDKFSVVKSSPRPVYLLTQNRLLVLLLLYVIIFIL